MASSTMLATANCRAVPLSSVPSLALQSFRDTIVRSTRDGMGLAALFASPAGLDRFTLYAVLTEPESGKIHLACTEVGLSYASLTPECPAAHWFEREIYERWRVRPEAHPWLKPIRFQDAEPDAAREPADAASGELPASPGRPAPGVTRFFRVEGEEAHEVAVGPVHAGVIEPGHFRFQCAGEIVLHLEISLGYQHRGAGRLLLGGPDSRSIHIVETIAGDTSVGHATAYCQAIESLAGTRVSVRAGALRAIGLELERAANHIGDLGALAGDVGFLPTSSWCGRIRGDALNMTASICGSRFGRGLVLPGGAGFDLDPREAASLAERLDTLERDARGAVELAWKSPSVAARYEGTGLLDRPTAERIGLVGPAARACGIARDVRQDFPEGIFRFALIPVSTWHTGDVFARAFVRWLETQRSISFVSEQVQSLPTGDAASAVGTAAADHIVVSMVEGWRGQICHVAITDAKGRFQRYEVVDPSYHNWFGLALAMRGGEISDFPLCNKSFNLSYCGHDL